MRRAISRLVVLSLTLAPLAVMTCLVLSAGADYAAFAQTTISEINPKQSSIHQNDPNAASGGRVNGLAVVPRNNRVFYAASEWGGLFRSQDGGRNWMRLNGHLPVATWDVEVSPADPNRIIATSFYDGRVNSLAGINVSTDGGNTWTRPATATPPPNFCVHDSRRSDPSAFGVNFDPANPRNVYVGTNCGLAVSNDGGGTWRFIDPTPPSPARPNDRADDVWDVVVHHGGIIDICGDDSHRRSTDGGRNWTTATGNKPLGSGTCSIAASPDESYVLFAVVGTTVYESDDGGANWHAHFTQPEQPQGRVPFVATNQRSGASFDLWFGDVSLYRTGCTTPNPAAPGGAPRCPPDRWAGGFTYSAGSHDDMGDIAFDTQAAADPCPLLMSSDGGVYFNTATNGSGCHDPRWSQPDVTPHALWLFGMAGADLAGVEAESLYFGNQDTGTFATTTAGSNAPTWLTRDCCDSFDVHADAARVLYTSCCWNGGRFNRLFIRGPGMSGGNELRGYPEGNLPTWGYVGIVDQFGPKAYALLTTSGTFVTSDITAASVSWTPLRGNQTNPVAACGVRASKSGTTPVFYVQGGACNGRGYKVSGSSNWSAGHDNLWKYRGTATGGAWQPIRPPGGVGGFGVFDVHPEDERRIIASHLTPAGVRMIISVDGGATWGGLPALDTLMTGSGTFRYRTQRGPTDFTGFDGYPQPTLVAFDPSNPNNIVVGAADSGLFYSVNGGGHWSVITNNSGGTANPIIPRPRFAYFDREGGVTNLYVGTQGRGAWRIRLP